MLERETILVARKIKVAICSFEVDHLCISEGCMGLSVKFISNHPKQETIEQGSIWTACVCGRQGVFLS